MDAASVSCTCARSADSNVGVHGHCAIAALQEHATSICAARG
ncbi:hypothetical protein XCR_3051 [Xanthomonas campestris pv. raphani 756C]|nr:hypothetical protein XCR_3051 [Xanthomonas campestris pv. raphani 756C]